MTIEQVEQEEEICSMINSLAVLKISAASKGDKNKFNLLCKQQLEVAKAGLRLAEEVEHGFF
jgi:hypothetical protein